MCNVRLETTWELVVLSSPYLPSAVEAVAAKEIPYFANANRLQTLNIYLAHTISTNGLIGTPATSLAGLVRRNPRAPRWQVHIHGGVWGEPDLAVYLIEAAAAHTFDKMDVAEEPDILGIASLNYTVSPFSPRPSVPDLSPAKAYEPLRNSRCDPARGARPPQHLHDVLSGFEVLRSMGLDDDSFVLTGHGLGASLVMQSSLQDPARFGLNTRPMPRPVAVAGLNGFYDLPGLLQEWGPTHAQLREEYAHILGVVFVPEGMVWEQASPGALQVDGIEEQVKRGAAPRVVLLDQDGDEDLAPISQMEGLEAKLKQVRLRVVRGKRCEGGRAAPWDQGVIVWETVKDILAFLGKKHEYRQEPVWVARSVAVK